MISNVNNEEASDEFIFSVDSALLEELGEKLVSSVHVALSELVKNAYDADASLVEISIAEEDQSTRLVIKDNGSGMTVDDVRAFWMRIGTGNKVDNPVSEKYGRRKTGAKGVGRFACRRLGANLTLTTTALKASKKNSSLFRLQTTTVTFNWLNFVRGKTVEDVISTGHVRFVKSGTPGTVLEIWGAPKNEWSNAGFNYLQRQLGVLATNMGTQRVGYENDPGFNVVLTTPSFEGRAVTDLRSEVIDAGWGSVSAHVDETGRAVCTLTGKGISGVKRIKSQPKFLDIKTTSVKFGIFPVDKEQFRRPEILSKQAAITIIQEWGGIHVKHNGFRIYPYGDTEDDWLRIEADRARRLGKPSDEELFSFASTLQGVDPGRSLLNMLSQKNYIGYVDVNSEIQGLVPRLDRQGFIAGDAFNQLKQFVRFAVDWANIYRDHYIRNQVEDNASKAFQDVQLILQENIPKDQLIPKVASYLRQEIRKIVQYLPEGEEKKQTEQSILTTLKAIETNNQANIRQLEHLRLIASASTLTLLFAHEVRTLIGSLGATSKRLKRISKNTIPSDMEEIGSLANQIDSTKTRFENLVEMTGIVGAFGKQKEIQSIHLKTAIERASKCFSLVIDSYKIGIDFSKVTGNHVVGPMIEGEIYTILINIISNSIKSLIASGQKSKKIEFSSFYKDDFLLLNIYDNGIGLAEDHFDEVLKPFVSDPDGTLYEKLEEKANPQDAHMFGTGSGLGLAIIKDIVVARKGNILFKIPPDGWETFIQLRLPCPKKN
ncbi:MAG: ATP-binding protein [Janthinobacterium svalbardensis]